MAKDIVELDEVVKRITYDKGFCQRYYNFKFRVKAEFGKQILQPLDNATRNNDFIIENNKKILPEKILQHLKFGKTKGYHINQCYISHSIKDLSGKIYGEIDVNLDMQLLMRQPK